ncbi:MAG TPA: ABC transporter substrate-binding protein [Bacteroides sp.]|nr:ABC transporter substrate-binding protein [Bacteroides sp.]
MIFRQHMDLGKSIILRWQLLIFLILGFLYGCYAPEDQPGSTDTPARGNRYARGFSIEQDIDFKILHVQDPWQGSSGIHLEYVLAAEGTHIPDSLAGIPVIKTPVSRVICMSTTHVAMISALGMTETIVGVSGPDYISNPSVRQGISAGRVLDVGADQSLNYERILTLRPDLVMAYGVTAEISGMVGRLEELGIPVILNADYLENEPLGKTEWLKFIAALYNKGREADSIFESIAARYEGYRELAAETELRPRVITGLPWKDAWYVPGGKSFAAAFIRDAGGDYVWNDMDRRDATPIDLESVYAKGADSDFWINSGSAGNLEDILQTESRLIRFKPYRDGSVYNNTGRMNRTGGNDFWETGVMEPDIILADLIAIFHPEIFPGYELRYYRQLQ